MRPSLSQGSSRENRKQASEALFDSFSELLFDRVNLINGTFAVSGATTSTSLYKIQLRVPDTSNRLFMRPDKKIRFRCTFYISGTAEEADAYILIPAVITDTSSIDSVNQTIPSLSVFDGYSGIRMNAGAVSLVSHGANVEGVSTAARIVGNSTHYLEIKYNINNSEIYLDNTYLGSVSCDLTRSLYTYTVFYPLLAPIRSIGGTSVNLNMESYQILQDK